MKKPVNLGIAKSKVLAMDKLNLHEKFTKENFLNLCSLRWSEWGRWRRFFVIAGAIAAIVVSAPSFVMILPCVTVFYLISCTVKNAVEIVSNWKWGPIFPKKRIKKDAILNEIEGERSDRNGISLKDEERTNEEDNLEEIEEEDHFLEPLESISGDDVKQKGEKYDREDVDLEDLEDEFELPSEKEDIDSSFDDEDFKHEKLEDEKNENEGTERRALKEDVLLNGEIFSSSKDSREESQK